ncbi:MAG: hypothetical protein HY482_02910 [Candidatus Wildermuthbacteria bacterium]|nr:hypothetical protein [Candidatus Wildermuthbacteria bacterium]
MATQTAVSPKKRGNLLLPLIAAPIMAILILATAGSAVASYYFIEGSWRTVAIIFAALQTVLGIWAFRDLQRVIRPKEEDYRLGIFLASPVGLVGSILACVLMFFDRSLPRWLVK